MRLHANPDLMNLNLFQLLASAGPLLWVLLLLSLYVVYLAALRFQVLGRVSGSPDATIERARATTAESGPAAALAELDRSGMLTPAATVLRAGLGRADRGTEAAVGAMNSAVLAEDARLYAGIQALGTAAQIGPLLGLLGTVIGMIEIFGAQAPAGGAGNPAQLAHGISVALYNTAFGLMVAIPALIFWRYFRTKVDGHLLALELAGFPRHASFAWPPNLFQFFELIRVHSQGPL